MTRGPACCQEVEEPLPWREARAWLWPWQWLVPTRVQDSESQGGEGVRAAAPGAHRPVQWSL